MELALNAWPHSSSVIALTCRVDTPYVHLGQSRHQSLLASLIPLEQLRAEPSLPVLRNANLQLSPTGDQRPRVVPAPQSLPFRCSLPRLGLQPSRSSLLRARPGASLGTALGLRLRRPPTRISNRSCSRYSSSGPSTLSCLFLFWRLEFAGDSWPFLLLQNYPDTTEVSQPARKRPHQLHRPAQPTVTGFMPETLSRKIVAKMMGDHELQTCDSAWVRAESPTSSPRCKVTGRSRQELPDVFRTSTVWKLFEPVPSERLHRFCLLSAVP
jgi:hypothetical protein